MTATLSTFYLPEILENLRKTNMIFQTIHRSNFSYYLQDLFYIITFMLLKLFGLLASIDTVNSVRRVFTETTISIDAEMSNGLSFTLAFDQENLTTKYVLKTSYCYNSALHWSEFRFWLINFFSLVCKDRALDVITWSSRSQLVVACTIKVLTF